MLRKVKLYGELAKFVGHKEFEVELNSVGKAVSFLIHNFPEVERFMSPKYYQVKVGNYEIDENELAYPVGQEDIHFIPAISGAGRGFGKVLLGAALIGGAFVFGGLTFAGGFGKSLAAASGFTKAAFGVGSALVLSGVSDMLFPLPDIPEFSNEEDPRISFNFSGIQNTSRAGTSHPIVYGEIVTGSVVISAGIDTNQVST